jgi:Tol biopolymer transport system component
MTSRLLPRPAAALAALVALALTSGCGDSDHPIGATSADEPAAATTAAGTTALPDGRIAFRRWLDDAKTHGAIFTVRTDGTGEQQLTHPASGADDYPDWSPDGRLIAYQHCAEGQPCSVWTVDGDGGTPRKVRFRCRLEGDCDASGPGWTSDGQLLATLAQGRVQAFRGVPQIQQSSLVALDLRSGRQQTIYTRSGWAGDALDPQVSPDGRTVIYTRLNSARSEPPFGSAIFAIGIDGTNHHQVASWKLGGGDHPVFSPRGTVLFRSFAGDDSKQADYWTVRPDGGGLTRLTTLQPGVLVTSASYSPDGKWIVHSSDGDGGADLYVMRADGTGNRPLTRTEWWDSAPDWEPTPR